MAINRLRVRIISRNPVLETGEEKIQLSAVVDNASNKKEEMVTWTIVNGGGKIDKNGFLTAKHKKNEYKVKVRATCSKNPFSHTDIEVKIKPVKPMEIKQANDLTVLADQTIVFEAKYDLDMQLSWHVKNLNFDTGSIEVATGVYTAPKIIPTTKTVTIEVINRYDGCKAEVNIKLIPVKISTDKKQQNVHIKEEEIQLNARCANDISGINNYKCEIISKPKIGKVMDGGIFTPPKYLAKPEKVTVKIISKRDPSKFDTAKLKIINFPKICPQCKIRNLSSTGRCSKCGFYTDYMKKFILCPRCNNEWDGTKCIFCNYPKIKKFRI